MFTMTQVAKVRSFDLEFVTWVPIFKTDWSSEPQIVQLTKVYQGPRSETHVGIDLESEPSPETRKSANIRSSIIFVLPSFS